MRSALLVLMLSSIAYSQQTCTLTGTVIDASTAVPIPRAQVEVLGPVPTGAATDSDGRWSISGQSCRVVPLLIVSKPHYASARINARETHDIQIKLVRESWVSGSVTDPEGDGIGASVRIYTQRLTGDGFQNVLVGTAPMDESGTWRKQFEPGDYVVCVLSNVSLYPIGGGEALRFPERCSPISIQSGQDARLDFTLTPTQGVAVNGTVTGVPQGTVPVIELTRSGHEGEINIPAKFAPDGKFSFTGVVPDLYTIKASAIVDEKNWYAAEDLTVGSGGVSGLRLPLQPAIALSGTVRIKSSHPDQLKPTVSVQLKPDNGIAEWNDGHDAFTISNIPPGKYRIGASANQYYVKSIRANNEDFTHREIDLSSAPGPVEIVFADDWGWIEGSVTDADDHPAESSIWIRQSGNSLRLVQSDALGRFRHLILPPGHYEAIAVEPTPTPVHALPSELKGTGFDVPPLTGTTLSLKLSNRP